MKSYLIIACGVLLLQGCAAAVVGGAAATASAAHDKRTTGILVEDQNIEIKAQSKLRELEKRHQDADIDPVSFNRRVLLIGQIPSAADKAQATALVSEIDNVREVFNEVRIKSTRDVSTANDAWITTKVKSLLLAEKGVDPTRIKVVTEDGEVFLMGLVNREVGDKAALVTRNVDGVKKVVKVFEYID